LIEVTVLSTTGNQVNLGTDAPPAIPIVWEELLEPLDA
jgi:sRNA-binding carbon storage regulator CsrA